MHPAIDILIRQVDRAKQRLIHATIQLLVAAFALTVLVIGGSRLVWITHTLEQTSASLGLPLSVVYLVIPLSGLFIIYYSLSAIGEPVAIGGQND